MGRMTVEKMKEIITGYKSNNVLNQDTIVDSKYHKMLKEVSSDGSPAAIISLLACALWFYTEGGKAYEHMIDNREKAELIRLNKQAEEKIEKLEKTIATYDKANIQRAKVANGEKIAYRKDAGLEEVKKLWKSGCTYLQMAEKLNISRATVANRIKELKELEKQENQIKI